MGTARMLLVKASRVVVLGLLGSKGTRGIVVVKEGLEMRGNGGGMGKSGWWDAGLLEVHRSVVVIL
jgi:hypothetical protein